MIRTDEQIKKAIVNRISSDTQIDASSVLVEVNNGRVILTGAVPTHRTKNIAYKKAKKIRGVIDVNNQLEVVSSEDSEVIADAEIERKAKQVLSQNKDIDTSKIKVGVDSGHVTLKGIVNLYWQLHEAEDLISDINGVNLVKNELAVVPGEKVSDEKIAKNINEGFNQPGNLEASSVLVEVIDGVVTLTGTVRSDEAQKQAYNSAARTMGVKKIINNVNVAMR